MQLSLEMLTKEQFIIDKPIRLIELFGGIGSQAKALQRLGADFEHHFMCEYDRFAVQSYNAVHGTNFEPLDITKAKGEDLRITETENYCYILTYSFPCQDLSMAGKREGMKKSDSTRSGLLWEVERLLNEVDELPQVLLMENVPQVHDDKNRECFRNWIIFLESKGYTSYCEDLNAKNYGVPQNRERCFMVSLLEGYYVFPDSVPLKERLKDRLEQNVGKEYDISDKAAAGIAKSTFNSTASRIQDVGGVHRTLCARDYKDPPCIIEESRVEDETSNGGNA